MTAYECGLHAIKVALDSDPTDSDMLIAAKCRALLAGYDARWHGAGYVPRVVEQLYECEFYNPVTEAKSRTFRLAGKVDVLADYNGRVILIDHKTTDKPIEDPAAPYWKQLVIEGQVSHYMLMLWQNGIKCDGAMWDVTHKPGIRPSLLTKAECSNLASTLRDGKYKYYGRWISLENIIAWSQKPRETLEMYEARLAHDCIVSPEKYFQRRTIPRLDSELIEYAYELWNHGQEIIHTRKYKRHDRNSGACMLYGRACKFLGICSGFDREDSPHWQIKPNVHVELPELVTMDAGREVLTNSRVRCFQTCRRKHYYEYEKGIERLDREEAEALRIGTFWHLALEAWWKHFLPSEEGTDL